MAARDLPVTTYVSVLVVLLLLTVLTVSVSFFEVAGVWHVVIGLVIAICKASLVVLFFMHAILSPRVTWVVIAVTIFWLVAVLLILAMSDYVTRGEVPFMPGH